MPQTDADNPTPTQPMRIRVARGAFAAGTVLFAGVLSWTTWQTFGRVSDAPALAAVEPSNASVTAPRPGVAWSVMQPQEGAAADGRRDDATGTNAIEDNPVQADGAIVLSAQPIDAGLIGLPSEAQASRETQAVREAEPAPVNEVEAEHEPKADAAAASPGASGLHPSQTRDAAIVVDGQAWTGPTFDGRPIRPVRTVTMTTTAYSPDEQSCGVWADGITASGMSVWTNGMKLVAADPSLPFGTILTVPGYNDGHPVPVLDRGGAIKGNRLDLLYPTHDIAIQWGVQELEVIVWEYADE